MCPTEYLFFSLSDFSFFAQSNMLQRLNEEETVRESQALFSFFFFFGGAIDRAAWVCEFMGAFSLIAWHTGFFPEKGRGETELLGKCSASAPLFNKEFKDPHGLAQNSVRTQYKVLLKLKLYYAVI